MGFYSQNQNDVWDNTPERRPKPKSMKSLRNLMSTMGMAPTKVVPIMPERRLVLGTFLGKSARQQRSSSQPELRSRENLLKPKRRHRRGSIFGGATTTTREEDRSVVQQQRRRNPVVEQVVERDPVLDSITYKLNSAKDRGDVEKIEMLQKRLENHIAFINSEAIKDAS